MDQRKTLAASVFNFLGGVSGLMSLAILIWYGGALWQTVKDHGRRIEAMEGGGSIGLREHVKLDDERVRDAQSRIARQEEISSSVNAKLSDLVGEVKLLNFKVDSLNEKLNVNGKVKP